jgi:hypothetical protein
MYVNGKMVPVETTPRMWEGERVKDSSVGGEFKCDIHDTLQELL